MVACQMEPQVVDSNHSRPTQDSDRDTNRKVIDVLGTRSQSQEEYCNNRSTVLVKTLTYNNGADILNTSDRPTNKLSQKMESKIKKKKFKPADHLYCFVVDGIFTSTKVSLRSNTEKVDRPDLDHSDIDHSDIDHYLEHFDGPDNLRCTERRSTKNTKLQKVHVQIRDEHFNHDKCTRMAVTNGKKYNIKQRILTRQSTRKTNVSENTSAKKNNKQKALKKIGVKLKGINCVEHTTNTAYHPIRLKFDQEKQRRKEPCRVKKVKQVKEEKRKEPRKVTPFKPAEQKKIEFAEYALHEGNISNAVDKQTKELIDLQYRDLTAADLEKLFQLETQAIIKKSLDDQLNRDLATVQKSIADAKELEDKIRKDSSRMLELMMQLQFRELSPEDYELLLRLDETVKPKVATSKAIRSLPSLEAGSEHEGLCCLICMDDYVIGERLKVLPCKHMYHNKCIEPWLTTSSNKCPLDAIEVS